MPNKILSFGYRHGNLPNGGPTHRVIDVRKRFFKNPYHDRSLRYLRGTDERVAHDIRQTPGFERSYSELRDYIRQSNAEVIWLGCSGGHHRSVFLAESIGKELGIPVVHRDIDKK